MDTPGDLAGRIAGLQAELEMQRYWHEYWKERAEWYRRQYYDVVGIEDNGPPDEDAKYDGRKCDG